MAVTGITDAMVQYGRTTESVYMHKPKNGKPYGIKRPGSDKVIAALAVIFVVIVAFLAI
jgi:hypothetical protein